MAKGKANTSKLARERAELELLLTELPLNPITWTAVIKILGPVIARLAVRYALKKAARSLSEDKVNAIGKEVGEFIGDIIKKRVDGGAG